MGVFHPSARVRLQLRLDDTSPGAEKQQRDSLEQDAPQSITGSNDGAGIGPTAAVVPPPAATSLGIEQQLERNQNEINTLTGNRSHISPEEFTQQKSRLDQQRRRLHGEQREGNSPASLPGAISESTLGPEDESLVEVTLAPISCSIERNGFLEADTATIVFDYRVMPIDPRTVRSCSVEILLGVVTADEYAQGIQGIRRPDGSLLSMVPRNADLTGPAAGTATRFLGIVKDWTVTYDESDGDRIELECQDFTALLQIRQLDDEERIDLGVPIDIGIQQILDNKPGSRQMKVVWRAEKTPPTPANNLPEVRKGKRKREVKKTKVQAKKMTAWDHIVDTCLSIGVVPLVRDTRLELLSPRNMFDRGDVPTVLYGDNLSNLHFARKTAGVTVPIIEVTSYDADSDRTRWARAPKLDGLPASGIYRGAGGSRENPRAVDPPAALKPNGVYPSAAAEQRVQVLRVSDSIIDLATLERIAQTAYDQIGRQEIAGSFETDDITGSTLTSQTGDVLRAPQIGELLGLREGSAIQIGVRALAEAGTTTDLQELTAMSVARRAAFLEQVGWPSEAARRVALFQQANLVADNTIFRVLNVNFDWEIDEGISVSVDFQNWIEVREKRGIDQPAEAGVEATAATAGRNSPEAENLRVASSDARTLMEQREQGAITGKQFDDRQPKAQERQRQAVVANRRV